MSDSVRDGEGTERPEWWKERQEYIRHATEEGWPIWRVVVHLDCRERNDADNSTYVACKECGRNDNTLRGLTRRPCRDGIPVDQQKETGEPEL